ncbi:hypothetical protein MNBD_DELTA03-923, partial [hydrothermal vent metagenome]
MKKNPFILTAVLAGLVLGACGSASASSYTINDHTWVAAGHSRSDAMSTDGVNGTAWMDVVGSKSIYNVYGINVVRSGYDMVSPSPRSGTQSAFESISVNVQRSFGRASG